MKMCTFINFC